MGLPGSWGGGDFVGERDVDGLGAVVVGGGAVVVDLADEVGEGMGALGEVLVVVGSFDEVGRGVGVSVVSGGGAPYPPMERGVVKPRWPTVGVCGGVDRRWYSLSGTSLTTRTAVICALFPESGWGKRAMTAAIALAIAPALRITPVSHFHHRRNRFEGEISRSAIRVSPCAHTCRYTGPAVIQASGRGLVQRTQRTPAVPRPLGTKRVTHLLSGFAHFRLSCIGRSARRD
jgi:hypothetical protein